MNKFKITKFILLVTLVIMLASCNTKRALDFNNKLAEINKSMLNGIMLIKADTSNKLQNLVRIQDIAKAKLKEVADVKGPDDGEAFKQAMEDDFQGVVDFYDISIKLRKEKDSTGVRPVDADEKIQFWTTKIADLDKNLRAEQKKFATKNNIRLQ